jgi:hypothetical protein
MPSVLVRDSDLATNLWQKEVEESHDDDASAKSEKLCRDLSRAAIVAFLAIFLALQFRKKIGCRDVEKASSGNRHEIGCGN